MFVRPEQRLSLTAAPNHERYNCRDDGTVRLQVKDADGKPVKAELAVSIFDKAYLYQPGHENILSHCYLSEQIRGSIFNPTYYFDEQNADRHAALDLLLLTQGWRRYVWDSAPVQARTLLTDGVSGFETARKDRADHLQFIHVFAPHGDTCLIMCDTLGRFEIDPEMMDHLRGRIYLKPLLKKRGGNLTFASPFDSINVFRHEKPRYLSQDKLIKIKADDRLVYSEEGTINLKAFTVKAKRREQFHDKVLEYLDSIAIVQSGVWVCDCGGDKYSHGGKEKAINEYNGYSRHPAGSPFTLCTGNRMLPKRGEAYARVKLELHGDKWYNVSCKMGPIYYHGPNYTEDDLLKINGFYKSQGYYPKREFYEPDPLDRYSPTPDPRNLLQWRPAVMTDDNGEAEIPFMASDINTEFVGVVEAIDGGGLLGCQTFSFRVMK